ncbi:hypothetical protein XI03_25175 [Bradyrhizobium sp. CCBAU 65884]|nr:hypothetical protein [Bradyrhizobium sp. CCBAU 65884]
MRDVSLREGDDPYAGEGHALKEPGNVLLIAAETVQRLGKHHRKLAAHGVVDQFLDPGAKQ